MTSSFPAVETRNLGKIYRHGWKQTPIAAVDGVSLRIEPGTTFGLVGPNGAGKTTFVKMLLGMTYASQGEARLFGVDARQAKARVRVGYLAENGRYPGYHTARSLLGFHGRLSGLRGAVLEQRIDEVLSRVAMREWESLRLAKHSKGMLQRVGIALALLHRPALLILDEPTDGVDPVGRSQIRKLLGELQQQGVTLLLNSHLLTEVEQACERVAILHRGRLVLTGAVRDLTHRTGYAIYCESPKGDLPKGLDHVVHEPTVPVHRYPDGRVRWHVDVATREDLNAAIDMLRRHESEIDTVERNQKTLEEVFLDAVRGNRRG